jgi:hypothetical protein
MRTHAATLAAAAILLLTGGGVARAGGSQCIKDAKNTFNECKGQCVSDFNDSKAECRGIQPGCFQACLDARGDCIDAARQPLTSCLDGCQATLQTHHQDCKNQYGCGGSSDPCSTDANFIACMNPFQLDAFICRDGCRDTFKLNTTAQLALKACAKGFKTCIKACPSSPSGAFLDE